MWKDINGWENNYEVSDDGTVRNKKTMRAIKGENNQSGYNRVTLYCKSHYPPKQRFLRHRVVATAFIPNPERLPEVDHIDCVPQNCKSTNLRWVTRKQNEQNSYYNGAKPYRPFTVEFCNGIQVFDHPYELAQLLEVSTSCVRHWLQHSNLGYQKYGISEIRYIENFEN